MTIPARRRTYADPPALAGNVVDNPYALANASFTGSSNVTRTASSYRAPDGSMNAALCVPTVTSGIHQVGETSVGTTTAVDWLARGRFRAAGYNFVELIIGSTVGYAKFIGFVFDLGGGRICSSRNATYIGIPRMLPLPDRWYFCEVRLFTPDVNTTHRVDMSILSTQTPGVNYVGDTVSGIYGWGMEFAPVPN